MAAEDIIKRVVKDEFFFKGDKENEDEYGKNKE